MKLLPTVALLLAGCSPQQEAVIDGSSPEAFAKTAKQARRDLPVADRLAFDTALRTIGGRRHAVRDPDALARTTFNGMTAAEIVADQEGPRPIGGMNMRKLLPALLFGLTASVGQAQPATPKSALQLWRLDCGEFVIKQYGPFFSDTFQYPAGPKKVVASCYLIKRGDEYMLWDTGLTDELVGRSYDNAQQTLAVKRSILDQLKQVGVRPEQIATIGISHWHFDHVGQAPRFPHARLLIGKADADLLRASPPADEDSAKALAGWLTGSGKLEPVTGDLDIFKDGSVVMLSLPGHTPGHHALLVRLASGPVLLSGDQYHFREQVPNRGVPPFNHNRADTLASHDRFDRIAANLKAKVIIQHEPRDIAKLPAFPQAAQ